MKLTNIIVFVTFLVLVSTFGSAPLTASEPSFINGRVYCDHNKNGDCDQEDQGLANIHVQIFLDKCGGTALQTIHTDQDGHFSFHNFNANTYYVRADIPCVCGGRSPTTTTCQKVVLKDGETVHLKPFGYTEFGQ